MKRDPKSRLASVFDTLRANGWEPGSGCGWDEDLVARNYGIITGARMKSANFPLAAVAVELLAQHQPDTVRGVMYLVVSNAPWLLPDTSNKSYDRIQRLLNTLRKKGVVPFEWIVDNVRETEKPSSWSGLGDFTATVRDAYRKDFWASLPEYVAVVVEKDTVAGRVAPVTREFDVSLHPLRGYSSTSFAWDIARGWGRIEKPITVYYVGDHDPSGRDIERSIRDELSGYSGREFSWKRLAVNPEDFGAFNIKPLAPKKKDSRYRKFVEKFGPDCAEVEAVPANDLRDMVRRAIEGHISADKWARLKLVEERERAAWSSLIDSLPAATSATK